MNRGHGISYIQQTRLGSALVCLELYIWGFLWSFGFDT